MFQALQHDLRRSRVWRARAAVLQLACSLLVLLGGAAALGPGSTLGANNVYYFQPGQDQLVVFAQGMEFQGRLLANTSAGSPAECAAACEAEPECDVFGYTACAQVQVPDCTECRLLSMGCSTVPVVGTPPAGTTPATQVAGFPVRYKLNELPGFTAQAGQGVPGADIVCPQSLIPGKCAVGSPLDGVILCIRTPDCQAIVHYFNGTDGCSEPVSLLVSDGLSQSTAFVSPKVATLSRVNFNSLREKTLMAQDGRVVLPPAAELPPNATTTDSTYLGCIISDHALLSGTPVEVVDGLDTPEGCCRRCRGDARCNLYQYCAQPEGCSYTLGPSVIKLEHRQCKLMYNEAMAPPAGFPPAVIAKGPSVPFVGGAPLELLAPPLPGYTVLPGRNQFAFFGGSFNCSFSLNPAVEECVVAGTAEEVADACSDLPECVGALASLGRLADPVQGVLKSVIDDAAIGLSPTNALLLRDGVPTPAPAASQALAPSDSGSSSGLSSGAIAGIAVGAAAVVAATAAAAWVLLQRQRRTAGAEASILDNGRKLETHGDAALEVGSASPGTASLFGSVPPSAQTTAETAASQGSGAPAGGLRSVTHPASAARLGSPFVGRPTASPFAARPAAASPFAARPAAVSPFASGRPGSLDGGSFGGAASGIPSRDGSASSTAAPLTSIRVQRAPSATSPFASMAGARARTAFAAQPSSPRPAGDTPPGDAALSPTGSDPSSAPISATASGISASPAVPSPPMSAGSSGMMLPELAAHIAVFDAAQNGSHQEGAGVGGELHEQHSLLGPGALPPSLANWLVDVSEIEYLRWPNGALQELGRGSSGVVYKARFRGELVAAKEVELGRSPNVQALFVTEAEQLHQLRHGNIITLYGVCLAGPLGILLMEHAAGRDLHSALRVVKLGSNERLFSWYGRGRTAAYDISRALNFLHAKASGGVVHLDIKSSNVLLTGAGTAKLADVGVARLQLGTHLTDLPGALGTFAWMAPELIIGGKCTTAVDIFSYGVVLWEIATGETPRRGSMRLPLVPDECPQEVADLIGRCMALDPAQRPTANQLMRELEELSQRGRRHHIKGPHAGTSGGAGDGQQQQSPGG